MNGFSSMDSYHLFVLLLICHCYQIIISKSKMADKGQKYSSPAFHILLVGLPLFVSFILL